MAKSELWLYSSNTIIFLAQQSVSANESHHVNEIRSLSGNLPVVRRSLPAVGIRVADMEELHNQRQ